MRPYILFPLWVFLGTQVAPSKSWSKDGFIDSVLADYRKYGQASRADTAKDGIITSTEFMYSLYKQADMEGNKDNQVSRDEFIDHYSQRYNISSELGTVMFDYLNDPSSIDDVITHIDVSLSSFSGRNYATTAEYREGLEKWIRQSADKLYTILMSPHVMNRHPEPELRYNIIINNIDTNNDDVITLGEMGDELKRFNPNQPVTRRDWVWRNTQSYGADPITANLVFDYWDRVKDMTLTSRDLQLITQDMDVNGDNKVDVGEFVRFVERGFKLGRRMEGLNISVPMIRCPEPWWSDMGWQPNVDATRAAMDFDDDLNGWITLADLRRWRDVFDENDDSVLDRREYTRFHNERYGVNSSVASVMFDLVDLNGDGKLDDQDWEFHFKDGFSLSFCDAKRSILDLTRMAEEFRGTRKGQELRDSMQRRLQKEWNWYTKKRRQLSHSFNLNQDICKGVAACYKGEYTEVWAKPEAWLWWGMKGDFRLIGGASPSSGNLGRFGGVSQPRVMTPDPLFGGLGSMMRGSNPMSSSNPMFRQFQLPRGSYGDMRGVGSSFPFKRSTRSPSSSENSQGHRSANSPYFNYQRLLSPFSNNKSNKPTPAPGRASDNLYSQNENQLKSSGNSGHFSFNANKKGYSDSMVTPGDDASKSWPSGINNDKLTNSRKWSTIDTAGEDPTPDQMPDIGSDEADQQPRADDMFPPQIPVLGYPIFLGFDPWMFGGFPGWGMLGRKKRGKEELETSTSNVNGESKAEQNEESVRQRRDAAAGDETANERDELSDENNSTDSMTDDFMEWGPPLMPPPPNFGPTPMDLWMAWMFQNALWDAENLDGGEWDIDNSTGDGNETGSTLFEQFWNEKIEGPAKSSDDASTDKYGDRVRRSDDKTLDVEDETRQKRYMPRQWGSGSYQPSLWSMISNYYWRQRFMQMFARYWPMRFSRSWRRNGFGSTYPWRPFLVYPYPGCCRNYGSGGMGNGFSYNRMRRSVEADDASADEDSLREERSKDDNMSGSETIRREFTGGDSSSDDSQDSVWRSASKKYGTENNWQQQLNSGTSQWDQGTNEKFGFTKSKWFNGKMPYKEQEQANLLKYMLMGTKYPMKIPQPVGFQKTWGGGMTDLPFSGRMSMMGNNPWTNIVPKTLFSSAMMQGPEWGHNFGSGLGFDGGDIGQFGQMDPMGQWSQFTGYESPWQDDFGGGPVNWMLPRYIRSGFRGLKDMIKIWNSRFVRGTESESDNTDQTEAGESRAKRDADENPRKRRWDGYNTMNNPFNFYTQLPSWMYSFYPYCQTYYRSNRFSRDVSESESSEQEAFEKRNSDVPDKDKRQSWFGDDYTGYRGSNWDWICRQIWQGMRMYDLNYGNRRSFNTGSMMYPQYQGRNKRETTIKNAESETGDTRSRRWDEWWNWYGNDYECAEWVSAKPAWSPWRGWNMLRSARTTATNIDSSTEYGTAKSAETRSSGDAGKRAVRCRSWYRKNNDNDYNNQMNFDHPHGMFQSWSQRNPYFGWAFTRHIRAADWEDTITSSRNERDVDGSDRAKRWGHWSYPSVMEYPYNSFSRQWWSPNYIQGWMQNYLNSMWFPFMYSNIWDYMQGGGFERGPRESISATEDEDASSERDKREVNDREKRFWNDAGMKQGKWWGSGDRRLADMSMQNPTFFNRNWHWFSMFPNNVNPSYGRYDYNWMRSLRSANQKTDISEQTHDGREKRDVTEKDKRMAGQWGGFPNNEWGQSWINSNNFGQPWAMNRNFWDQTSMRNWEPNRRNWQQFSQPWSYMRNKRNAKEKNSDFDDTREKRFSKMFNDYSGNWNNWNQWLWPRTTSYGNMWNPGWYGGWNPVRYRRDTDQVNNDKNINGQQLESDVSSRARRWQAFYPQTSGKGWRNNWDNNYMQQLWQNSYRRPWYPMYNGILYGPQNKWWSMRYPREADMDDNDEQARDKRETTTDDPNRNKRWGNNGFYSDMFGNGWSKEHWNMYPWGMWHGGMNPWANVRYPRNTDTDDGDEQTRSKRDVTTGDATNRNKRWGNQDYNSEMLGNWWNKGYDNGRINPWGMWYGDMNPWANMRYPRDTDQDNNEEQARGKRDEGSDDLDRNKRWGNQGYYSQMYGNEWIKRYGSEHMDPWGMWYGGVNPWADMRYPRDTNKDDRDEQARSKRDATTEDSDRNKRWGNQNYHSEMFGNGWNKGYGSWHNMDPWGMWYEGMSPWANMRYPRETDTAGEDSEAGKSKRDAQIESRSKRWYSSNSFPWSDSFQSNFMNFWNRYTDTPMQYTQSSWYPQGWNDNQNIWSSMRYPRTSHAENKEELNERKKRDVQGETNREKRWQNWDMYGIKSSENWKNFQQPWHYWRSWPQMFPNSWYSPQNTWGSMRYSRDTDDDNELGRNKRDASDKDLTRNKRWWGRQNNYATMFGNQWNMGYDNGGMYPWSMWYGTMNPWANYVRYQRHAKETTDASKSKRDTETESRSKRWNNFMNNPWSNTWQHWQGYPWNYQGFGNGDMQNGLSSWFSQGWNNNQNMWDSMRYPRGSDYKKEDESIDRQKREVDQKTNRDKRWQGWGEFGFNSGDNWFNMQQPWQYWGPWPQMYTGSWHWPQHNWNSVRYSRDSDDNDNDDEQRNKRDINKDNANRSKRWEYQPSYPQMFGNQWNRRYYSYMYPRRMMYEGGMNPWGSMYAGGLYGPQNNWNSMRHSRDSDDNDDVQRHKRDTSSDNADRNKRWGDQSRYPQMFGNQWSRGYDSGYMYPWRMWQRVMNPWGSMRHKRDTGEESSNTVNSKRDAGDEKRSKRWYSSNSFPQPDSWQRWQHNLGNFMGDGNRYLSNFPMHRQSNWFPQDWNTNQNMREFMRRPRGIDDTKEEDKSLRKKRDTQDETNRKKRWQNWHGFGMNRGNNWGNMQQQWEDRHRYPMYGNGWYRPHSMWSSMRYLRDAEHSGESDRIERDASNDNADRSKRWENQYDGSPMFGNGWNRGYGRNYMYPWGMWYGSMNPWSNMRYQRNTGQEEETSRSKRGADEENRSKRWFSSTNYLRANNWDQWQWYPWTFANFWDSYQSNFPMHYGSSWFPGGWNNYMWSSMRYPRKSDNQNEKDPGNREKHDTAEETNRNKRWQNWQGSFRNWMDSRRNYMASDSWSYPVNSGPSWYSNFSPSNGMQFSNRYKRDAEANDGRDKRMSMSGSFPRGYNNMWSTWYGNQYMYPYMRNDNWRQGHGWGNPGGSLMNFWNMRYNRETDQQEQKDMSKRNTGNNDRTKRWQGNSWYMWPRNVQDFYNSARYLHNSMTNDDRSWYDMWNNVRYGRAPRDSEKVDEREKTKRDTGETDRLRRWDMNGQMSRWGPWARNLQWSFHNPDYRWDNSFMSPGNWWGNSIGDFMRFSREADSKAESRKKRDANEDSRSKRWQESNMYPWRASWLRYPFFNSMWSPFGFGSFRNNYWTGGSMPWGNWWGDDQSWNSVRNPRQTDDDDSERVKRDLEDANREKRWQGNHWYPWSRNWQMQDWGNHGSQYNSYNSPYSMNSWMASFMPPENMWNNDNMWSSMRYPRDSDESEKNQRGKRDTEEAERSKRWQGSNSFPSSVRGQQWQWSPHHSMSTWNKNWNSRPSMFGSDSWFPNWWSNQGNWNWGRYNRWDWNTMRYPRQSNDLNEETTDTRNKRDTGEKDRSKRWHGWGRWPMMNSDNSWPNSWNRWGLRTMPWFSDRFMSKRNADASAMNSRDDSDTEGREKRWNNWNSYSMNFPGSFAYPWWYSGMSMDWNPHFHHMNPGSSSYFYNRMQNQRYGRESQQTDIEDDSVDDSVHKRLKRDAGAESRSKRWYSNFPGMYETSWRNGWGREYWNKNSWPWTNPWWMSTWESMRYPRNSDDSDNDKSKRDTQASERFKRWMDWSSQYGNNWHDSWKNIDSMLNSWPNSGMNSQTLQPFFSSWRWYPNSMYRNYNVQNDWQPPLRFFRDTKNTVEQTREKRSANDDTRDKRWGSFNGMYPDWNSHDYGNQMGYNDYNSIYGNMWNPWYQNFQSSNMRYPRDDDGGNQMERKERRKRDTESSDRIKRYGNWNGWDWSRGNWNYPYVAYRSNWMQNPMMRWSNMYGNNRPSPYWYWWSQLSRAQNPWYNGYMAYMYMNSMRNPRRTQNSEDSEASSADVQERNKRDTQSDSQRQRRWMSEHNLPFYMSSNWRSGFDPKSYGFRSSWYPRSQFSQFGYPHGWKKMNSRDENFGFDSMRYPRQTLEQSTVDQRRAKRDTDRSKRWYGNYNNMKNYGRWGSSMWGRDSMQPWSQGQGQWWQGMHWGSDPSQWRSWPGSYSRMHWKREAEKGQEDQENDGLIRLKRNAEETRRNKRWWHTQNSNSYFNRHYDWENGWQNRPMSTWRFNPPYKSHSWARIGNQMSYRKKREAGSSDSKDKALVAIRRTRQFYDAGFWPR